VPYGGKKVSWTPELFNCAVTHGNAVRMLIKTFHATSFHFAAKTTIASKSEVAVCMLRARVAPRKRVGLCLVRVPGSPGQFPVT